MKTELLQKRKFEYLSEKINELGTDDIYVIAQAFDKKVDTNENMAFTTRYIPGYSIENKVVGELFALEEGENSGIIEGNAALFICVVDKITRAPELENYISFIDQRKRNFMSYLNNNQPYRALQKNTDIKDYRHYFY